MFETLFQLLEGRYGLQAAQIDVEDSQAVILARQLGATGDIPVIVQQILVAAAAAPDWNIDISKCYMLKQNGVVYAWRFIVDGDLDAAEDRMTELVRATPEAIKVQETEVSLGVSNPDRNKPNARGKGCGPMNSMLIGPALMSRMGGA